MDALPIPSASNRQSFDGNTLNSAAKIIIKKENIGLHEHQHQKYQYNLFNNNEKRDKFYEDLSKMKDRMGKVTPNMQQIIHMDMKRANTNKLYERKLSQELTGPRGLDWQCKQEIQRLENNEREAVRDLIRLRCDLKRASVLSLSNYQLSPRQRSSLSRSQTPRFSISTDRHSIIQMPVKTKPLFERSFSINTSRTTIDCFTPMTPKRLSTSKTSLSNERAPWVPKQIHNRDHLRIYAHSINQQKREIQQKLHEFLH